MILSGLAGTLSSQSDHSSTWQPLCCALPDMTSVWTDKASCLYLQGNGAGGEGPVSHGRVSRSPGLPWTPNNPAYTSSISLQMCTYTWLMNFSGVSSQQSDASCLNLMTPSLCSTRIKLSSVCMRLTRARLPQLFTRTNPTSLLHLKTQRRNKWTRT